MRENDGETKISRDLYFIHYILSATLHISDIFSSYICSLRYL